MLNEIIGQRLNRLSGVARLHILAIVADKNGLCRLDNDDPFSALYTHPS